MEQTKICTKCDAELPLSEYHKHRDGLYGACKSCRNEAAAISRAANPEKAAAQQKKWRTANHEKVASYNKKYSAENPEKVAAYRKASHAANPEKAAAQQKKYRDTNPEKRAESQKKYSAANPEKINALAAKRRAKLLSATVPWSDIMKIYDFYVDASELTRRTGIPHQVDHVIPLNHPLVCGLHTELNLQILTAEENLKKSNKFIPGFQESTTFTDPPLPSTELHLETPAPIQPASQVVFAEAA